MFFMILYEQSYVLNELIRVNDSLWDKIENNGEVNVFKGISNLISELLEIELDISFIYNQLKIKGTMETQAATETWQSCKGTAAEFETPVEAKDIQGRNRIL